MGGHIHAVDLSQCGPFRGGGDARLPCAVVLDEQDEVSTVFILSVNEDGHTFTCDQDFVLLVDSDDIVREDEDTAVTRCLAHAPK